MTSKITLRSKQMTVHIDRLLDSIEKMIDAQDDMWQEEQNCNYRWKNKIHEEEYLPAKNAAREALREAIIEVVREQLQK